MLGNVAFKVDEVEWFVFEKPQRASHENDLGRTPDCLSFHLPLASVALTVLGDGVVKEYEAEVTKRDNTRWKPPRGAA